MDAVQAIGTSLLASLGDGVTMIIQTIASALPVVIPVMIAMAVITAGVAVFRMFRKGK